MHRAFSPTLALTLLTTLPASAPAQSVVQLSVPTAESWQAPSGLFTATGPADEATPGEHAPLAAGAMVMSSGGSRHEGITLMIVGGAGILTGLLIDESVVTVAGAAVAGVGLYLYLK